MKINWQVTDTDLGPVFVAASASGVVALKVDASVEGELDALAARKSDVELVRGGGTADAAAHQIREYFEGKRWALDVPLDLGPSTEFQERVRNAVRAIPAGETRTYGEVAAEAGYPRAARAVGNVMRTNRVLLGIPCHRVVASDGIGGFGGRVDLKRTLLTHEKKAAR